MEKLNPKTIQIFLPNGDPRSIRIAEITTRIVRVIEIPRNALDQFLGMPESTQNALYFLVGIDPDTEAIQIYIGQTGGIGDRLRQHDKDKEFWNKALVVISLTNSFTTTHTLFLEELAIRGARAAARYSALNGTGGNQTYAPPPMQADCHEIYETMSTLLTTLGYPIFEPLLKPSVTPTPQEIFFCKGSEADGRGTYTDEGFVVLKDSTGRVENVPSIVGTSMEKFRERLIEDGDVEVIGDRIVFIKNHLFGSPSMAAVALMGRRANGWIEWKSFDGKTLSEIKRGPNDEATSEEAE
jgi:hypothetical protein